MKARISSVLLLILALLGVPGAEATRAFPTDLSPPAGHHRSLSRLLDQRSDPTVSHSASAGLFAAEDSLSLAALAPLSEPARARILGRRSFHLGLDSAPLSRLEFPDWGQKTASRRNFWSPAPKLWETRLFKPGLRQGGLCIQPDPLGPVDSPNLYQAFGFDGLNVTDPFGLRIPKFLKDFQGWLYDVVSVVTDNIWKEVDPDLRQFDEGMSQSVWWTKTLVARPGLASIGWYKTAGEGAFGLGLLATDVGATYVGLSLPGTDERLAGVADFFSHPVDNTIANVSGQWKRMAACEQAGDWACSSEIAGSLAFQTYATVEGVAGLSRAGIGIANRFTPAVVANEVPARVARVFSSRYLSGSRLAHPSATEAWITAADDIAGISSAEELASRLTLVDESGELIPGPYAVIEFDLPDGVASPVFRDTPGFVGRGRTAGGAREFVIPNYSLEELLNPTKKVVE